MEEKDFLDETVEFIEEQVGLKCDNWDSANPRNIMQAAFDFFWMHRTEVEPQEPKKKSGPTEYLDFLST